jgi:hypothetical protein
VVRVLSPWSLSGDLALELAAVLAEAEKAAASGIALLTPRIVETGSFAKVGHASAPDWLASVSGTSSGVAKGRLVAAEGAAVTPTLRQALHDGELSTAQLAVVTKTAAEAPDATADLLDLVHRGASHQELSDEASRRRAGARRQQDERAQRQRVHAKRHLRWSQVEGGGIRGEFSCDEVTWAGVAPGLEAAAHQRWRAAGSQSGEPLEAHRLDAFIEMLAGSTGHAGQAGKAGHAGQAGKAGKADDGGRSGARHHSLVIIDAEALRRGTTEGDELCEIEGIGPVSVAAATELLGEGGMQYLVREGFDIKTVTKSTRVVTQCIDMALLVRDRTCVVPACGRRLGLERDHFQVDYARFGPTELKNLARLCTLHHDMKTNGGWRLSGGPGHWGWIPPERPPSAGRIDRNRRLAAARGNAAAARKRDRPQRT